MKLKLYWPVKPAKITQNFGNVHPLYTGMGLVGHNGIDFWAPDSYPIYAAHDGEVTFAGYDGSGGYGVVVRTTEQFEYKDGLAYYKTIYWHSKKDGIKVIPGRKVKTGDLLALADNTGISTGSHLHFGLKPQYQGENDWTWGNAEQNNGFNGAIDPTPYLIGIAAQDYSIWTKINALTQVANIKLKILIELIKVGLGY